mmetsp:Transcript_70824/g.153812  ORF Transcript_70824/g.153812 Transcript_70824/m.153812 type:complete len:270 (+) Transcript_70824:56-865(+)
MLPQVKGTRYGLHRCTATFLRKEHFVPQHLVRGKASPLHLLEYEVLHPGQAMHPYEAAIEDPKDDLDDLAEARKPLPNLLQVRRKVALLVGARIVERGFQEPGPLVKKKRVAQKMGEDLIHLAHFLSSALRCHEGPACSHQLRLENIAFLRELNVALHLQEALDEKVEAFALGGKILCAFESPAVALHWLQLRLCDAANIIEHKSEKEALEFRLIGERCSAGECLALRCCRSRQAVAHSTANLPGIHINDRRASQAQVTSRKLATEASS